MAEKIFVTGACGFVGSRLTNELIKRGYDVTGYDVLDERVVNPQTVAELSRSPHFELVRGNILDIQRLEQELTTHDAIIHAAAISSVDRSIKNPTEAILTNTVGTQNVMEAARKKGVKRVHYVSTDEVFGHSVSGIFDENSSPNPRNPYAAGKLGGEAATLAWGATFGLDVTVTNSVNNYGPYQAPEKLIPRLCVRGVNGNTLPVYGTGKQVREWLFVDDHVKAILHVLNHGTFGERYCVGSGVTHENIEIVNRIVRFLGLNESRIEHIPDRNGHDLRYALDSTKINNLGWTPEQSFNEGIDETIDWYKQKSDWWKYYMVLYPDLAPKHSAMPQEQKAA